MPAEKGAVSRMLWELVPEAASRSTSFEPTSVSPVPLRIRKAPCGSPDAPDGTSNGTL